MSEVFTINGALPDTYFGDSSFGATRRSPKKRTPVPKASTLKSPAVSALQVALVNLGKAVQDNSLAKIKVEGQLGPLTVAAVNRALTVHLGAGQAPSNLRTGKLSAATIFASAIPIATLLNVETARRRAVAARSTAPGVQTTQQAQTVPAGPCPPGWGAKGSSCGLAPKGTRAPAAAALQDALRALGNAVRDGALMKIKSDGLIGPGTTAAVNHAFTTHIGPGQAAPGFRTGALTTYQVAQNAIALAQIANAEAKRRLGLPGTAKPGTPNAQTAPCPPGWGAKGSSCGLAPKGTRAPAAAALQDALRALGNAVRDGALMKIKSDGLIGTGTTAAVNRAFTTHIGPGQAAPGFRTGALTTYQVAQNAIALAQIANNEARRRTGQGPLPTASTPAYRRTVPKLPGKDGCPAGQMQDPKAKSGRFRSCIAVPLDQGGGCPAGSTPDGAGNCVSGDTTPGGGAVATIPGGGEGDTIPGGGEGDTIPGGGGGDTIPGGGGGGGGGGGAVAATPGGGGGGDTTPGDGGVDETSGLSTKTWIMIGVGAAVLGGGALFLAKRKPSVSGEYIPPARQLSPMRAAPRRATRHTPQKRRASR